MTVAGDGRKSLLGTIGTILAVAFLLVALLLPNRPSRLVPSGFVDLPAELPVILLLLMIPGIASRIAAVVIGFLLGLMVAVKLGDIGAYLSFARPFNPALDLHLLSSAMDLLAGAIGPVGAFLVAVAAGLLFVGLLFAGVLSLLVVRRVVGRRRQTMAVTAGMMAVVWGLLSATETTVIPGQPLANFDTTALAVEHGRRAWSSLDDLARFETAARVDAWSSRPPETLLTALKGRDVFVIFVESYGRTVLDDAEFGPLTRPFLKAQGDRLEAAGYTMLSGFLTSPTVGGMSWLAHGTAMSGLWVDNQQRYQSLVASSRMTLNRAFGYAGWRTVAVMPAITMAWPEGSFYGYDQIYAAGDLGYRGKPFNWVTMPDQYTLSALDRLELAASPREPVMAEIALISSHAPWTPVPRLVDWNAVGDGTVFNDMASEGDPPNVVWQDTARVRRQFRDTVDYSLETIVSFIERRADPRALIVILGDHQPAPLVTGDNAGRAVPVHVITGDAALAARIADFGWTAGLVPADDAPEWPMDQLRDRLLGAFSDPAS